MNALLAEISSSVALWIVIKASILLGGCALVQFALGHRASAATRHRIWMLGLALMLVLPVISMMLPKWPVVIHLAPSTAEATSVAASTETSPIESEPLAFSPVAVTSATPEQPSFTLSWYAIVAGAYWIGAGALLVLLALQRWNLRRLARASSDVHEPEWAQLLIGCADTLRVSRPVRLLRSRERNVPMAFGTRRPVIVIPAIADLWAVDRRRAVLLHELAHVARYDYLTHTVAAVVC